MDENKGYTTIPFEPLRQLIVDSGRLAVRKHTIRGLLQIDVTAVRQYIHEHASGPGGPLSMTAYIIYCLGQAINANRTIHAYRKGRNQVVIFDDVDVLTYVEVEMGGEKFPLAYVLRSVNTKTWHEIHDEIRSVQSRPGSTPNADRRRAVKWFLLVPAFVRDIVYRFINRHPHIWKKYLGTVYLTSVGMFGNGAGWGIGYSAHTLGIIIGGIGEQTVVHAGEIEIRDCMNLTAEFDHDLIDGAPAARFIGEFKKLIEKGSGFPGE
jgi:pyruvate/2-oxoglutarate dehydrogenase complex dihydrolipoamide acyltransferase (E2) component